MTTPYHQTPQKPPKQLGQWVQQLGILLIVIGLGFLGFGWFSGNPEHSSTLTQASHSQEKSSVQQDDAQHSSNRLYCQVLSVYDGDTFACDLNGNGKIDKPKEQIRMVGIDTPEMHYSNKNKSGEDEPGAKAASEFTQNALHNQRVEIEQDKRPEDKYGRTLAYVYLSSNPTSLNEQLLAKGLATHFFIPPNTRYESQFLEAEAQAQEQKLGLWAVSP
jgi:micrococcal nuclease